MHEEPEAAGVLRRREEAFSKGVVILATIYGGLAILKK